MIKFRPLSDPVSCGLTINLIRAHINQMSFKYKSFNNLIFKTVHTLRYLVLFSPNLGFNGVKTKSAVGTSLKIYNNQKSVKKRRFQTTASISERKIIIVLLVHGAKYVSLNIMRKYVEKRVPSITQKVGEAILFTILIQLRERPRSASLARLSTRYIKMAPKIMIIYTRARDV